MGRVIRKSAEGEIVMTTSHFKLVTIVVGILVSLATGALGGARFIFHAQDSVTHVELREHITADSMFHILQKIHTDTQDTTIIRQNARLDEQGRQNHELLCFVARYPKLLCP